MGRSERRVINILEGYFNDLWRWGIRNKPICGGVCDAAAFVVCWDVDTSLWLKQFSWLAYGARFEGWTFITQFRLHFVKLIHASVRLWSRWATWLWDLRFNWSIYSMICNKLFTSNVFIYFLGWQQSLDMRGLALEYFTNRFVWI